MATAGQRAVAALGSSRATHDLTGLSPVPPGAVSPRNVALHLASAAFEYYDRRRAHRILQEQVAQENEARSLRLAKLRRDLEPEPTESLDINGRTFSGLTHNQAATLYERNAARGGSAVETISEEEAKALGLTYGPGMTRFVAREQLSDRRRHKAAAKTLGELQLQHKIAQNRISELDAAEKNYVQDQMSKEDSGLEDLSAAARSGRTAAVVTRSALGVTRGAGPAIVAARKLGITDAQMKELSKDPLKLDKVVTARVKHLRAIYENTHRANAHRNFEPQRRRLLGTMGAAPGASSSAAGTPARDGRVQDANSDLDAEDF